VAERLARRGIACRAEDVLITTGSQQALDLIGRVLVAPGRPLLTESPTYVGALQAFLPFRPEVVSFPMDADGLRVDELERWLEQRSGAGSAGEGGPSLLYTVPTYQNPSGVTMSLERRRALLEVARAWRLAVVEDDPYSELSFGQPSPPALRALPGSEEVIHLGTFSKILSPGLRVGWAVGPPEVIDRLATAKQGTDLHTDGLAQRIVHRWCQRADVEGHIAEIRRLYARRRDVMLDALEQQMPEGMTWTRPEGGMFVWLTLPEGVDSRELLRKALERDVAFVPGTGFHADGEGARSMRLNFTNSSEEGIREGVRRLAETIGEALRR
jgi:2-aminoadipate transaminase